MVTGERSVDPSAVFFFDDRLCWQLASFQDVHCADLEPVWSMLRKDVKGFC